MDERSHAVSVAEKGMVKLSAAEGKTVSLFFPIMGRAPKMQDPSTPILQLISPSMPGKA